MKHCKVRHRAGKRKKEDVLSIARCKPISMVPDSSIIIHGTYGHLVKEMPLSELIETADILTLKAKGLNIPIGPSSPRVISVIKTAEGVDRKAQDALLRTVKRYIVTRNREQHKPTEEAKVAYRKLLAEE